MQQRDKSCEKGSLEEQENSTTDKRPLTPRDTPPQGPTPPKQASAKPLKPGKNEPGIKNNNEEKNEVFPIQTTPLSIDSGNIMFIYVLASPI